MQRFESREIIKARMQKNAARQWGYDHASEINMDAFDPLIDLLMGAFAFELEQLGKEIESSRTRIFEHLLGVLAPDSALTPQPAHTIMQAVPIESTHITNEAEQYTCQPSGWNKELFFSPIGQFPLINGKIELVAYQETIFRLNNRLEKEPVLSANFGNHLPNNTLYLGIDLAPTIQRLHQLVFYIDWKKELTTNRNSKSPEMFSWSINGKELACSLGVEQKKQHKDFLYTKDVNYKLTEGILNFYRKNFYTLSTEENIADTPKVNYPTFFKSMFPERGLERLAKKLLWITVKCPIGSTPSFEELDIAINCFPVVNRRLRKKEEKIENGQKMIPLELEGDYFLSINSITDDKDIACLLYTSPSPRDRTRSRMPSSA